LRHLPYLSPPQRCFSVRFVQIGFLVTGREGWVASSGISELTSTALGLYGLARKRYNAFKAAANNEVQPISFGRHAPKGMNVFGIDIRSLSHPKTIQGRLFREAMQISRACVDAYIALRVKKTRS
jgi:hypothetical protein